MKKLEHNVNDDRLKDPLRQLQRMIGDPSDWRVA